MQLGEWHPTAPPTDPLTLRFTSKGEVIYRNDRTDVVPRQYPLQL